MSWVGRNVLKPGDKVTTKVRKEAYYSDYAGSPEVWFEPDMEGVVVSVDTPAVRSKRHSVNCESHHSYFVVVTFTVNNGVPMFSTGGGNQRVSLYPDEIRRI